jgi:hypothetical protein
MSELEMQVTFNEQVYTLTYNKASGYYETTLIAPSTRWNKSNHY